MKTALPLFVLFLSVFTLNSHSQEINLSIDSLTKILCEKKWEIDYTLFSGMKIYRKPDATNIILDFKKDKTLTMNDGKSKKVETGKWVYDQSKKQVKLNISGRSLMVITSITPTQIFTSIDPEEAKKTGNENADLADLKTVFKIKAD